MHVNKICTEETLDHLSTRKDTPRGAVYGAMFSCLFIGFGIFAMTLGDDFFGFGFFPIDLGILLISFFIWFYKYLKGGQRSPRWKFVIHLFIGALCCGVVDYGIYQYTEFLKAEKDKAHREFVLKTSKNLVGYWHQRASLGNDYYLHISDEKITEIYIYKGRPTERTYNFNLSETESTPTITVWNNNIGESMKLPQKFSASEKVLTLQRNGRIQGGKYKLISQQEFEAAVSINSNISPACETTIDESHK